MLLVIKDGIPLKPWCGKFGISILLKVGLDSINQLVRGDIASLTELIKLPSVM